MSPFSNDRSWQHNLMCPLYLCSHCRVQKAKKDLRRCAACHSEYYCSPECQRAQWKEHRPTCQRITGIDKLIKEHSRALGPYQRELMPNGISLVQLNERYKQWKSAHGILFSWACLHALFPAGSEFTRNHFLMMVLSPRADHGNTIRKYFRVTDLVVYPMSIAEGWGTNCKDVFAEFKREQEQIEKTGEIRQVALMMVCPALHAFVEIQDIFIGVPPARRYEKKYSRTDWKEIVMSDIERGTPVRCHKKHRTKSVRARTGARR